jgi:hypothetical protein
MGDASSDQRIVGYFLLLTGREGGPSDQMDELEHELARVRHAENCGEEDSLGFPEAKRLLRCLSRKDVSPTGTMGCP